MGPTAESIFIGIDPSVRKTGLAIANGDDHISVLKINCNDAGAYQTRALSIVHTLGLAIQEVLQIYDPNDRKQRHLICECPEHFDSERGHDSAQNEAVQKLYLEVGAIIHMALYWPGLNSVSVVNPIKWKGNVKKHLMVRRAQGWIERKYNQRIPLSQLTDDAAEAALLVRYLMKNQGSVTAFTTLRNSRKALWQKTVDIETIT
jgi:hypothetical protein